MSPEKKTRIYEFLERFLDQKDLEEFVKLMEADNDGNPPSAKDRESMGLDSLPPDIRRRVLGDIVRREGEALERSHERWPNLARIASL